MTLRRLTITVDMPAVAMDSHGVGAAMLAPSLAVHADNLATFMRQAVVDGNMPVTLSSAIDVVNGVSAVQTIACVQASAAGNYVNVLGEVFLEADVPSGTNQFTDGADDDETATNLGAVIAAHPNLIGLVTVGVVDDTVTVTGLARSPLPAITTDDVVAFVIVADAVVGSPATVVRAATGNATGTLRAP